MIQLNSSKAMPNWLVLIGCVLFFNQGVQAGVSSQLPRDSQLIQQENIGDALRARKLDRMFASLKAASNVHVHAE